jgi:hypothetical protein
MLSSDEALVANPHCLQARDSPLRSSRCDLPFTLEVPDGEAPDAPYVEMKHLDATVHHWGQLKLLLGELEFLTPFLHARDVTVVYAGSSPGHHLKVLVEATPDTWKWELFDDKPNDVYASESIHSAVVEKLVTARHLNSVVTGDGPLMAKQKELDARRTDLRDRLQRMEKADMPEHMLRRQRNELWKAEHTALIQREHRANVRTHEKRLETRTALMLHKLCVKRRQTADDPQLLFISDIRTSSKHITEALIEEDMRSQRELTQALGPYQASLKFRLPYSDHYPVEQQYLAGKLLYQPFSPKVSHECRLHACGTCKTATYNRVHYNNHMFHFQTCVRTSVYDDGDALPSAEIHPNLVSNGVGTDHCYDCKAARHIIKNYVAKMQCKHDYLAVLNQLVGKMAATQRRCWADGCLEDE